MSLPGKFNNALLMPDSTFSREQTSNSSMPNANLHTCQHSTQYHFHGRTRFCQQSGAPARGGLPSVLITYQLISKLNCFIVQISIHVLSHSRPHDRFLTPGLMMLKDTSHLTTSSISSSFHVDLSNKSREDRGGYCCYQRQC